MRLLSWWNEAIYLNVETKVRVCHFSLVHNVFTVKDVITLAEGNSLGETVWQSKVTSPSSQCTLSQTHFQSSSNCNSRFSMLVALHAERDETIRMPLIRSFSAACKMQVILMCDLIYNRTWYYCNPHNDNAQTVTNKQFNHTLALSHIGLSVGICNSL